ncbi:MAG: hypothetical protein ACI9S8_001354 [Chlamydiales bacterium]|jgi:hypothetical protein
MLKYIKLKLAREMMKRNTLLLTILTGMNFLLMFSPANADDTTPRGYQIKAAFLYQFAKFVEWPETSQGENTLTIGIYKGNPFGEYLKTLDGKLVKNKVIQTQILDMNDDLQTVDILFITKAVEKELAEKIDELRHSHILTVSDIENFASQGGIIEFYEWKNKIHFRINPENAKESRLTISSRLLQLADLAVNKIDPKASSKTASKTRSKISKKNEFNSGKDSVSDLDSATIPIEFLSYPFVSKKRS